MWFVPFVRRVLYSVGNQTTCYRDLFTYGLDAADRVSSVSGSLSGTSTNYASGIAYTAASGISSMVTGAGTGALTSTLTWNDRLQLTGLNVTNPSMSQILGLSFYPCPGSATACGNGNNGNVYSQTISVPSLGSLTQTYSYDALNRLTAAAEGSAQLEQYSYDGFGNRWVPNHNSSLPASVETPTANVYTTSIPNRITGWTYDNAGNILGIPLSQNNNRNFGYDGENRQVVAAITGINGIQASYAYDGNGLRVSKTVLPGGTTTYYVYDAFGNLAAEYGPPEASPCATTGGPGTCYVTSDHLGSTRMLTDVTGAARRRYDFLPFGTEIPSGFNGRTPDMGYLAIPDDLNPKFTGQMRDSETSTAGTSLDWFNVRHMSGGQGRFQSPDPANAGANPSNPQSWNGYAYVTNNPLSYVDPTGLYCLYPNGGTTASGGTIATNSYDGTIDKSGCQSSGGKWYNNPTTTVTVNGDDDDSGSFDATYVGTTPGGSSVLSTQHFSYGPSSTRCVAGVNGAGFGWVVGASGALGLGPNGAYGIGGATAYGGGNFFGGGNNTRGIFASSGVAGTNTGSTGNYPANQSGNSNATYGAFAGIGGGLFFTNAGNSTTLGGPFTSYIASIGIFSGELDYSNGTFVVSFGIGKSIGLGLARMQTNTYKTECR